MRKLLFAAMLVVLAAAAGLGVAGSGGAAPGRGTLGKWVPTEPPAAVPGFGFTDGDGAARSLADFRGQIVLLNLWATWCAPCLEEMPSLDRLQGRLGGRDFQVVAISLDRGGRAKAAPFYEKLGLRNLKLYLDPPNAAMAALRPRGLPTTLLIDRQGREVGRLEGGADWDSPEAVRLIEHYLGQGAGADGVIRTGG